MQLIPDSRESGTFDDTHPLTVEFKAVGGVHTFHSKPEVGMTAVVGMTASGAPNFLYATNVDMKDAADLLRRFMKINKAQLVVGRLVLVQPIPNLNVLSVHIALPNEAGGEEWVVGYMAVDPYHPREVKPLKQSSGPRQSENGAPLVLVDDTAGAA